MFSRRCVYALIVLLALMLSACGSSTTAPAQPPSAAPPAAPSPEPTAAAPSPEPTAAAPTAAPAATAAPTIAPAAPARWPVTITDVAGRKVTVSAQPQRFVALAPSGTEILFALGLGPKVVAVDDFSDYPAEAKSLPKIGGNNGTYNYEQIVALKPDLIFAAGITPPEAVQKLEELKQAVIVLGTAQTTFESINSDIAVAGQVTGQTDQASQVNAAIQQKLAAIKAKVATATTRPRVYWELDATDPAKPYAVGAGSFVSDLIAMAGGTNVFEKTGSPFPQVSSEQIVAADPEVIILSDAAYGITVDSVLQRPGWQGIAAVKQKRVEPIDDNLVSRPGPRIADGLEATAKIIHPELFK